MKKIIRCLLFIMLAIPFVINASTYSNEVSKANTYLERESYKNTYNKYILYGSSIPYNYENGELKTDASFNKGGFISKSEFESTKVKNLSYLFDGTEYWTLTKDGSNVYAITYTDMETAKSPSSNYSGRVTEYVKSTTKVKGSGTYSNPWTFDPMFKVTVKTDNRYATINESENNVYVRGLCNQADCKASIGVEEKSGYRYITNNCGATYNTETKKIEISDVRRDTICTVVFGTGNYKITLVGATPNTIYLKYGENYYSDTDMQTIIRKINSITQKRGYTYKGYQYNGYPVIDEDLNIVASSVDKIYDDAVINATYEPIKIPCGSGEYLKKNDVSCTTCPAGSYCSGGVYDYSEIEDQGITECPSGYTSNSGTSNINQCYINVGDGKYIATVYSSTQTNCPAGTYKSAHQVNYGQTSSCTNCPAGTYRTSTGGKVVGDCTKCVAGTYSSATGATSATTCQNCPAGKYSTTVGATSATTCQNCSAGTSSPAGSSTASACTTCSSGTYNTTAGSTCAACPAGKYCTGGQNNTNCPAGTYRTSTGGKTSGDCTKCPANTFSTATGATSSNTCTACPTGYSSSAGSDAKSDCSIHCNDNYRVNAKDAKCNTACATGYKHSAHDVAAGSTSSACSAKTIKVTFKINYGGKTNTNVQTFTYGVANQKFANTGFTRSGYTLDGWSLSSSGSRNYSVNSGVSDSWINSNAPSINLYAVWKSAGVTACRSGQTRVRRYSGDQGNSTGFVLNTSDCKTLMQVGTCSSSYCQVTITNQCAKDSNGNYQSSTSFSGYMYQCCITGQSCACNCAG